ncbi:hypothetical protein D3C87_410920 [compost metagenome]
MSHISFLKWLPALVLSVVSLSAVAAPRYPMITEVQGQAWVTGKDGKRIFAKRKQALIEQAQIETSLSSRVKIDLDGQRSFIVQEASEVMLPAISWESGQAPVLLLKKGAVRWQQPAKERPYNVAVRSDLFEFIPPAGDYVFIFEPSRAYAEVRVFDGGMEFSALNGEDSVWVKAGQQVGFQGVLEGGQIAYDVLLKGKKIPRGKLTAVVALDKNDLKLEEARIQALKKEEARKKAAVQNALDKAQREGIICEAPKARLNECSWICEKNPKGEKKACLTSRPDVSCTRRRCNANGQWAEDTVLSAEIGGTVCRPQVVIAPCDY